MPDVWEGNFLQCPKPASAAVVLVLGLLLILWLAFYAAPADAARRIALVIGNGDYIKFGDLHNPVNDARAMADKLRSLDFTLIGGQAHLNVNRRNMIGLLKNLENELERTSGAETTALVYYSGHGVAEDNQNWLVPVNDGDISYREDVPDYAIGANSVMRRLDRAGGRLNILILDACRNTPLPSRTKGGSSKGLVPVVQADHEADSMIVYAAAPQQVAYDGPRNGLSPFTKSLIEEMDEPGRRLVDVMAKVRAKVRRETAGMREGPQVPWVNHSMERPFYFVPCPPGADCPDVIVVTSPPLLTPWKDFAQKRECSECPLMVAVPAGSYSMGSSSSDRELLGGEYGSELPNRSVAVRRFAVGVHEVTFSQWDACYRDKGCSRKPLDNGWGRGNRPVIDVSWEDAIQYVEWLSNKTGETYRLLSESEWEYVARSGTTSPFHTGSVISTRQANYGNSQQRTVEVGRLANNKFGLYDVHGNVWEWVQDCWHNNYEGAPNDSSAWVHGGDCGKRVYRGGSWKDSSNYARSAYRWGGDSRQRAGNIGFRVARTLH